MSISKVVQVSVCIGILSAFILITCVSTGYDVSPPAGTGGVKIICMSENKQIGVSGTDHAVWGYVCNKSAGPVANGTPVNVSVLHGGSYYHFPVAGGTVDGFYSTVLNGSDEGIKWETGDVILVNATYDTHFYSNQSTIISGTDQRIDISIYSVPEFSAVIVLLIALPLLLFGVSWRKAYIQ